MQLQPPPAGCDVRVLRKYVEDLVHAVNPLLNMIVQVEARERMQGKLEIHGDSSLLRIVGEQNIGDLGN